MKSLNYDRLFTVTSLAAALLFFALNLYTPLIADDFSYSNNINSVYDIVVYQYNHYFSWGGRSVAHFLTQFWLLAGKPFFNIANTIIYCAFILLAQFHITGNFKKKGRWFFAVSVFFWAFVPAWGQNFLWLTGSCNYLWTTAAILFFLLPFRKKQDNPAWFLNFPLSALFFLAGVIAGWSNENSGAAVLFLLLAYFVVKIAKKDKFSLFEITGTIGFLAGFFLLIAAPGNYARARGAGEMGLVYFDNNFLLKFVKRFLDITLGLAKNYGIFLILAAVFFGYDLIRNQKRKIPLSFLYALAALAGAYSMLLAPGFPDRAYLIVIVFAFLALGNIFTHMSFRLPGIIKRNAPLFVSFAAICFSFSFLSTAKDIAEVYLRWQNRIEYFQAEKSKGNFELSVEPIETKDKHSALYGLDDLSGGKNNWPNTSVAEYFGLLSVRREGDAPSKIDFQRNVMRQILVRPWTRMRSRENQSG